MLPGVRGVAAIVLSIGAVGVSGCSKAPQGPETVRVSGTLYLDGKPLEGAEVRFFSMGFVGSAISSADGRYELVQGAVPGENIVTVSKIEGDFKLDPEGGYDLGQLEAEIESRMEGRRGPAAEIPGLPRQVVPGHYSDPSKSKLTYMVPEAGTESADLRLASK